MAGEIVTVFGGSGFIGRYVVRALARRGWRVRVAVRRPHLAHFLQPMGSVGQIQLVQANLRDDASVARALKGAKAVVNLVAVLEEFGKQRFDTLHVAGAARVARLAAAAGVEQLVHISAIGADEDSPATYGRTKAAGEKAVREAFPRAVIVRPSIVFGPEDQFFNRFANMARHAPALPLIGGGRTRFQPVFAGDVAEAVARVLDTERFAGRVFELGGPNVMTFREIFELIFEETRRRRLLVPLPFFAAEMMARAIAVAWFLPRLVLGPLGVHLRAPLTRDQVLMLRHDNVVGAGGGEEVATFEDLGIKPVAPQAILPTYLVRYRRTGQFTPVVA
jgi:uncharacterized protein YbjT (DUF2867 family)